MTGPVNSPLPEAETNPPVPFFDWAGLYAERAEDFRRIAHETALGGRFILQRDVDEFEANLAAFLGVKHAVGVSDGTNAILLGLRACGLPAGAEVILPSHSFIAAAQSIHFAGGVPIPVELREHDWLVDPEAIRAAITPRTRGIMPVHVNGRTCQMDEILRLAEEFGLEVYEDSAQALGATLDAIPAGTFGRFGTFSFYPSKTLGCFGDAGALVTNDDELADRVRRMRNHGANHEKTIPLDCDLWGTNSRLDNGHAAILNYKLGYYREAIRRRREIASRYDQAFRAVPSLCLPPAPDREGRFFDIYQNYELCTDRRDALRTYLRERGIGTIVQWGGFGLHQLGGLGFRAVLPKTDRFFDRSLLLPMNHILIDAQVDHVITAVVDFFRS